MKLRYRVKGTQHQGDSVRLLLQREDLIDTSPQLSMEDMIGNPNKMIQNLQQTLLGGADTLSIPYSEWKDQKFKIDDIIVVDITPELL